MWMMPIYVQNIFAENVKIYYKIHIFQKKKKKKIAPKSETRTENSYTHPYRNMQTIDSLAIALS